MARRAWGEAENAFRRALAIAEAIGQPRQTWQSHAALARLHEACGRVEDARAEYRAAWTVISDLRARTRDPGVLAGLASLAAIREIIKRAHRAGLTDPKPLTREVAPGQWEVVVTFPNQEYAASNPIPCFLMPPTYDGVPYP